MYNFATSNVKSPERLNMVVKYICSKEIASQIQLNGLWKSFVNCFFIEVQILLYLLAGYILIDILSSSLVNYSYVLVHV